MTARRSTPSQTCSESRLSPSCPGHRARKSYSAPRGPSTSSKRSLSVFQLPLSKLQRRLPDVQLMLGLGDLRGRLGVSPCFRRQVQTGDLEPRLLHAHLQAPNVGVHPRDVAAAV